MRVRLGIVLLVVASGCRPPSVAAPPPSPSSEPFACSEPESPEDASPTIADAPIGRLEVRRLTGPFKDWQGWYQTRVKIVAEAVPLSSLATALGDALGVPVSVERDLQPVRVSIAVPDARVVDVLEQIHTAYPFWAFTSQNMAIDFSSGRPDADYEAPSEPRQRVILVLPVSPASATRAMAELACPFLSRWGTLNVVGTSLVVRDREENLTRIRELVTTASKTSESGESVWTCSAPQKRPGYATSAGVPAGPASAHRVDCPSGGNGPCLAIRAAAAPIGTLATAIAEPLGYVVLVDARLVAQQVTISEPAITLEAFLDRLKASGVSGKVRRSHFIPLAPGDVRAPDTLRLYPTPPPSADEFPGSDSIEEEDEGICHVLLPIHTLMIPLRDSASARQLAAAFCNSIASDTGHVTVVGKMLLVQDHNAQLEKMRELARSLAALPPPAPAP